MKLKKLFLIIFSLCLTLSLACGIAACKDIGGDDSIPVASVGLDSNSLELEVDGTYKLIATVLPSNATEATVRWSSDNTEVATVSDGLVTAKAVGNATITATAGGKSATCAVKVKAKAEPAVRVTSVTLNYSSYSLALGATFNLSSTVLPANATNRQVTWTSSNEKVATVSNGKVTAVGEGNTDIKAEADGKSATCTVTVKKEIVAVTDVVLDRTTLTLKVGAVQTVNATVKPSNATDGEVKWTSSNEKVATVSNGKITAVGDGTATVTATAGGKSATCTVTVEKDKPATVPVKSVTLNKDSLELKVDETFTLKATVSPSNATDSEVEWTTDDKNVADVVDGLVTAKVVGTTKIYATAGGVTAECEVGVIAKDEPVVPPDNPDQPITNSIITYAHAGEESAAFEWNDTNSAKAKVEYKLTSESSYTQVDSQLVRRISSSTVRADILGLKGGAKYDFKITSSDGKTATVKAVEISAYDRSGYAHFKYTDGVGAYNDDGTVKSDAEIVYVTEANKNDIDGKGTSIVEYLSKTHKTPVIVRFIGKVGAATWKAGNVTYTKTSSNTDSSGNLLPEAIVGKNGQSLEKKDWTQAELIDGKFNELDKSKYAELDGLSSKIKWDSGKNEYDSCWNDCSVSGLSNVTLEGVGEDARIFQWGITFRNCKSIEVRNLTFEDYTEDACSFEGTSKDKNLTDPAKFTYNRIWVHHNTFEEGVNYWDVCKEQDKHDGDGSTDFKYVAFVTLSYNVYNKTHKTGLIGGSNDQSTASVTFHHNFYNTCKSRLPLARQANMHMYNNYYKGTTGTDISLRAGAYALVENCYFDACNRAVELQYDAENGSGAAKVINCVMNKNKQDKYLYEGVSSTYIYIGTDRQKAVPNDNKFGTTFDTNTTLFYYDSAKKCSNVTDMLAASDVKTVIPQVAGVMKRKSNIKIDGGTEADPNPVDPTPDPVEPSNTTYTLDITALKEAAPAGGTKLNDIFTATEKAKSENITLDGAGYAPDGISFDKKQISLTGGKVTSSTNGIQFTVAEGKTAKVVVYAAVKVEKASGNVTILAVDGNNQKVTVSGIKINGVSAEEFDVLSATEVKKYEFTLAAGTYNIGGSGGGAYIYGLTVTI